MNSSDFAALNNFVGRAALGLYGDEYPPKEYTPKELFSKCIPSDRRGTILQWLQDAAGTGHAFEFAGRTCLIDGVPIPFRSPRPFALAWIVMAARQYELGAIKADWFPADGRSLAQSVRNAATTAERHSHALASVMRSFRLLAGEFVITAPDVPIRCISPPLVRAVLA